MNMSLEHNTTDYFKSKDQFIEQEIARLQAALKAQLGRDVPLVRIGWDFQFPVSPFTPIQAGEPVPCVEKGATPPNPQVINAFVASENLPPLPLDCALGAKLINENVRFFQAEIIDQVPTGRAQEISPNHPALARAEIQFIDNGKIIQFTEEGQCIAVACENEWKNLKPYKEQPIPIYWRPHPTATAPIPATGTDGKPIFQDLPNATPDELACMCQGIRGVIKELRFPEVPPANGPVPPAIWSNFAPDADNIPDFETLLMLDVLEAIIFVRAECLVQTFCPCVQIIPPGPEVCPPGGGFGLRETLGGLIADGGEPSAMDLHGLPESTVRSILTAADKSMADPSAPPAQTPIVKLGAANFLNAYNRAQAARNPGRKVA